MLWAQSTTEGYIRANHSTTQLVVVTSIQIQTTNLPQIYKYNHGQSLVRTMLYWSSLHLPCHSPENKTQFMSLIHNSCAITTACYNHFSHCVTTAMCYPTVLQQPCVTPLWYNSHVLPHCVTTAMLPHYVTTAMCYPIVLQQPCVKCAITITTATCYIFPLCYNSHLL